MSNYFTKNNIKEVGPGPIAEIDWLVVQCSDISNGPTEWCIVKAKNAYQARCNAEKFIPMISTQRSVCYPGPVLGTNLTLDFKGE